MSTRYTPEPAQVDYHADVLEERRRRALHALDAGDLIATAEDLLAQEPDPAQHPLYGMAMFFLDRTTAVDGAKLYDAWRTLLLAALERLIDQHLQAED
jgi:hypothetical protein